MAVREGFEDVAENCERISPEEEHVRLVNNPVDNPGLQMNEHLGMQRWVVEFWVNDNWVSDGFNLDDDRALNMLAEALPHATIDCELDVRVVEAPKPRIIELLQGMFDEKEEAQLEQEENRQCEMISERDDAPEEGHFYWYVPEDSYVEGKGFRPSLVHSGIAGHFPNGGDGTEPWYWGFELDVAREIARSRNSSLGLTDENVDRIIASSMNA